MKKLDKIEKGLLIAIFVIIVLVGAIVGYNKFKDSDTQQEPPPPPGPDPNPGPSKPKTDDSFPLKIGSEGSNVKYLQRAINKIISNPSLKITEDGKFGNNTYNALVSGVGTTTWWDAKRIPTYPVTQEAFTLILQKGNQNLRIMYGETYSIQGLGN